MQHAQAWTVLASVERPRHSLYSLVFAPRLQELVLGVSFGRLWVVRKPRAPGAFRGFLSANRYRNTSGDRGALRTETRARYDVYHDVTRSFLWIPCLRFGSNIKTLPVPTVCKRFERLRVLGKCLFKSRMGPAAALSAHMSCRQC